MINKAVFDTNILIDFSRDRREAVQLIQNCSDRLISVVTWVEFMAGLPLPLIDNGREFLQSNFDIIYPDEQIAEATAGFRRARRLKFPDAMIYATAQSLGVRLVTRNTKDFDKGASDIYVPYEA